MRKAVIAYESKYGNTKRVGETIVEGMSETKGVEATLSRVKEADFDKILDHDLILIGSPNHVGGPIRSVKRFINKPGKLNLEGKQIAVFDTYLGKDFEKAVRKMG
jgi:NAD(P)H dehydrogenase (quinone)